MSTVWGLGAFSHGSAILYNGTGYHCLEFCLLGHSVRTPRDRRPLDMAIEAPVWPDHCLAGSAKGWV